MNNLLDIETAINYEFQSGSDTVQCNIFKCGSCDKIEFTIETSSLYSDPVVMPPRQDWQYLSCEAIQGFDKVASAELLLCPECCKEQGGLYE